MKTTLFSNRHIGIGESDCRQMLASIGTKSMEDLIEHVVPENIHLTAPLQLDKAMSEQQYTVHLRSLSLKNKCFENYIGLGYHPTVVPAVIQRNILENPGWYTAYTPYQAEIAQGRLEALLNFQTMVTSLTGMELANASLLDESTAVAEGMILLYNTRSRTQKKNHAHKFLVSKDMLPQTLSVLKTRAKGFGIELVIGLVENIEKTADYFGICLQYPSVTGSVDDLKEQVAIAHEKEIRAVVAADLMSLALLTPPGEWGADVVAGSTQRFGIPMGYGGPHAAYFATLEKYKRNIPGRIIGVTKDLEGKHALRMALQTREQHIKRERATSNICTAQVLLAVMAGMYGVYHGAAGIEEIATEIHLKTVILFKKLKALGIEITKDSFFDTLELKIASVEKLRKIALDHETNLQYASDDTVRIAINEKTDPAGLEKLVGVFEKYLGMKVSDWKADWSNAEIMIPKSLQRKSTFLEESVFNRYHSETELMRYIKKLERRDLSLNHSMIALGSCTMKLNAANQMLPLSWPEWSTLHPFAPVNQAQGYQEIFKTLESDLNEITGFAATSLQPNSGAQGEYAGLLVIDAYQKSIGQGHRNVCIIPSSAHGTNPASAVMAGMKVVVTKATESGDINWEDLKEKVISHRDNLSALMVTYPSTHGVFEENIKNITDLIHEYGGQVYMDGANMNAQVGLTNPATIGADVCHLNLHKTFAIPHGGGGPGMGPICVAKHLAPFLPSNPIVKMGGRAAIDAISATPWGSSLVLLISYGYIKMLGSKGLQSATEHAILNANYLRVALAKDYDILYTGAKGFCAHEMIVDFRAFKARGIEVVDIAKRLMDYGYHAPTVSFPVPGTMMIEPTESESKSELDRFIDAMRKIYQEIQSEEQHNLGNSPLKNAPHTLAMATAASWDLPYSRTTAVYPITEIKENKFWPSVRRVDEAFGDRNLICSCAPISDYE